MSSPRLIEVGECDAIAIEGADRYREDSSAETVTREEAEAIVALASQIGTVDSNFRPRIDGAFLRLGQCVGALSVPGLNLLIRPKIEVDSAGRQLNSEAGILDLSSLLSATEELELPNIEYASPGPVDDGMLLRYADAYTKNLLSVMRDGLRGGYVDQEAFLSSVRGRMVFGGVSNFDTPHLVRCAYQEFTMDTLLNRTLKRAIVILESLVSPVRAPEHYDLVRCIRMRCRQLAELMEGVADVDVGWYEIVGLEVSRLDARFENALKFAKLIIKCNAPTHYADDSPVARNARAGFSYLWDVKRLFERYVAGYLSEWIESDANSRELGLKIVAQDSRHTVLDVHGGNLLLPDLVVYAQNKPVLIIDTKWKRLPKHFRGIDRNDAYQMLAYAMTYSWKNEKRIDAVPVCLLYPVIGRATAPRYTKFKGSGSLLGIAACPMDKRNREFSPRKVFGKLWPGDDL